MKYKNRYGYKICYREKGRKRYVRYFKTYSYKQAIQAFEYYICYPPLAREDSHVLKKPKWKIVPINRHEIRAGIWKEVPF